MWVIEKMVEDGVEFLPDIADTSLVSAYEIAAHGKTRKDQNIIQLGNFYMALSERDNYYQFNSPTAYGNPDYSYLCGVVAGFLKCGNLQLSEDGLGHYIVKRGRRTVLIVDKIKRPSHYIEQVEELRELRRSAFG